MVGEQRFVDVVVVQEFPRVPGVLARDQVRLPQGAQGAQGDVLHVADRGGDYDERHRQASRR